MDRTLNALQFNTQRFQQQENASKTYTVSWGAELESATISTSAWSAEDSGVTIANEANTTTEASARLTGSNPGTYRVVNKIVDSGGDTHERVLILTVKDNDSNIGDYL